VEDLLAAISAILVALLPCLVAAVYFARENKHAWICFLVGGTGWLGALILRLLPLQFPILIVGQSIATTLLYLAYSSILAGIFEEGIRYLFLCRIRYIQKSLKCGLSFGLGWGFVEAVVVYAVSILAASMMGSGYHFAGLLPGALERNIAIVAHVSYTLIVLKALKSKKFLLVAIVFHAVVDFFASVMTYSLQLPVWSVEGVIAAITMGIFIYAYLYDEKESLAKAIGTAWAFPSHIPQWAGFIIFAQPFSSQKLPCLLLYSLQCRGRKD
jgi:uncharacterized membrane protein YhfC